MIEQIDCDIAIVGAGTAGCVLADTLSRDSRLRVTLIEAGTAPSSPLVSMPAGFAKLFRSKLDWAFESEPQQHAGGRRIFIPRGRMLGGSANLNAQIHQWGHPEDFSEWTRMGADGWGWSDVAPTFKRQESFADRAGDSVRGRDGPQSVSLNRHVHDGASAFVAAARAAGLGERTDYSGSDSEGAYIAQINHRAGRRWSVYDAYLKPAMKRKSLRVITRAQVERVVFQGRHAVGVKLSMGGDSRILRARTVILAAGAIGSPHLLMLSGVGPEGMLRRAGVDVLADRSGVGANLHDHPMTTIAYGTSRKDTFKAAETPQNLIRYLVRRTGPLASNIAEAIAFARSSPELKAPDIELLFAPLHWNEQALKPPDYHGFTIGAALLAPVSRGKISLGEKPDGPPHIDFGFFADAKGSDKAVMLAAMRLAHRVAGAAPLKSMISRDMDGHPWAGAEEALFRSACRSLQTVYHPAGTCRMGKDDEAVVSPRGKVQGVGGLWVADASVMPSPVRGHPNATIAMLAERIAGFVLEDVRAAAIMN